MTNTDPRSLHTKQGIADAMFALLNKNAFQNITVNDICIKAAISRTTFYRHFEDKFELGIYCVELFKDDVRRKCKDGDSNFEQFFDNTLAGMYEYRRFFSNLLKYRDGRDLEKRLTEIFYKECQSYHVALEEEGEIDYDIPISIVTAFNSAGILSIIDWWVHNNYRMPREELVKYALQLHLKDPYSLGKDPFIGTDKKPYTPQE